MFALIRLWVAIPGLNRKFDESGACLMRFARHPWRAHVFTQSPAKSRQSIKSKGTPTRHARSRLAWSFHSQNEDPAMTQTSLFCTLRRPAMGLQRRRKVGSRHFRPPASQGASRTPLSSNSALHRLRDIGRRTKTR